MADLVVYDIAQNQPLDQRGGARPHIIGEASNGAPQKPLRAARRHAREQRSSRRPMRLVQLVLVIAENTDVGFSQDELLAHPRLTALYSAHASAAYQAFADDIKELTRQSLIGMRTQPASTALIRYDATTKHFYLAQPLHVLHLDGPTLAALQALLTALKDGAVLPGGKELCERLLALVPPDQLSALVTPAVPQTLHHCGEDLVCLANPAIPE